MKTQLMFRQQNGKLGKVSFDDNKLNIEAVQNQTHIQSNVISLGRKLKTQNTSIMSDCVLTRSCNLS